MKAGVYKIVNRISGDYYIGSSVNLKGRWWKHLNHLRRRIHKNPKLQNAWNKYKEEGFIFEILLYCDSENCVTYEQIVLDHYQPKYNCTMIAGNGNWLGKKHTEASKEKNRQSKLGQKHSAATKQLMSKQRRGKNHYLYGRHHSIEAKQKMSRARIGKYYGNNAPSAKLDEDNVKIILQLLQLGTSGRDIAKQFGVNESTISSIKLSKTWRYIER